MLRATKRTNASENRTLVGLAMRHVTFSLPQDKLAAANKSPPYTNIATQARLRQNTAVDVVRITGTFSYAAHIVKDNEATAI